MADKYVRVRLLEIQRYDLNLFDFDYDLTWAAFFMNADGYIYGRFGGRDAKGPDTRNTLAGLRFAMEKALETHKVHQADKPAPKEPLIIDSLPSARKLVRNGCIHCHQTKEIRRQEEKDAGTWRRDSIWVYPLPENVGITLDLNQGNLLKAVAEESPAAKAGLQAGDVLKTLAGRTVFSFADAQYALHYSPAQGEIPITWEHEGQAKSATLQVPSGWRKTNLTWRPSLLDLLPSLTVFGYDLTAKEKADIGLGEKQLAFRQISPVHADAQAIGVREGDVIVGIEDRKMEMTAPEFLGYVRQNYLIGDRIVLNVLRDGKRLDLPAKLR